MSFLIRQIARYAVKRLVSDPRVRTKAVNVSRVAVEEAKKVAGDANPSEAAGRAVRKVLKKIKDTG